MLPKPTNRPAPQMPPAVLIESAYNCQLSTYIDMIVDDKLDGIIISGNPLREQLEEAKMKIISEFHEISGGGETKVYVDTASSYYAKLSVIAGFDIAIRLMQAGMYAKAIEFLNKYGVKCSAPTTDEELKLLINMIDLKLKNRLAKLQEASSKFKALSSKKKCDKPTRAYFNRLLVMLSTCEVVKIQLNPKKMTVAEFAEYLNVFNEYQNQLKIRKYGKR